MYSAAATACTPIIGGEERGDKREGGKREAMEEKNSYENKGTIFLWLAIFLMLVTINVVSYQNRELQKTIKQLEQNLIKQEQLNNKILGKLMEDID